MDISELALKLIILLLPGAIAALIFEKLALHKQWNDFKFVFHAILFGGLSYVVLGIFYNETSFWQNLSAKEIPFSTVWKASVIGVIIGFIAVAADTHKWLTKFCRKLKISTKYGDENLYSYFLNSKDVVEVYIRDKENNFTYWGFVDSFSEKDNVSEIVLYSVKVFEYTSSEQLYELDKLYLSREKCNISIELPYKIKITKDEK